MVSKKNKKQESFLESENKLDNGCLGQEKQFRFNQANEIYSILTPFVNEQESFNILTVKGHTNETVPFYEWIEDEVYIPSKCRTNKNSDKSLLYKYIHIPVGVMECYFVYKTYIIDITHHVNEEKKHYIPIKCILDIWTNTKKISDIPKDILELEKNV